MTTNILARNVRLKPRLQSGVTLNWWLSLSWAVALATIALATMSAAEPPQYQKREYAGKGGEALKHVVYVPDKLSAEKPVPLLIFLHGSSADCVTHERILKESNLQFWHAYSRNVQSEPTILMAPVGGRGGWTSESREQAIFGIIDGLLEEFPVDRRRIYLQGFSMGGGGTWHLLQRRPGFFAAANPQALAARSLDPAKLKDTPIWATIGSDDRSLSRMTANVAAVRAANGDARGGLPLVSGVNPHFTVFPDTNHGGAQGGTQKIPGFKQWMYAQINDGNIPPNVRFIVPKLNARTETGDVEASVAATDADGKIARVEFYHGDKKVAEDAQQPFTFHYQNLPTGAQVLKAKAVDEGGKSRTAELVVQVGPQVGGATATERREPSNLQSQRDSVRVRTGVVQFSRWEEKIKEFEARDKRNMPAKNSILFAGSSSIVMWKLNESYPDWRPINRGFGGSFLPETTFFAKRTILKHRPQVVVLYSGENDLARDRPTKDVVEDFREFVKVVREPLPKTTIVFLAIKPTRLRWRGDQRDPRDQRSYQEDVRRVGLLGIRRHVLAHLGRRREASHRSVSRCRASQ